MITPIPPLETLLFGIENEGVIEGLEAQAWQALDAEGDYDKDSFIIGYRFGLLAVLGSLRERLLCPGRD